MILSAAMSTSEFGDIIIDVENGQVHVLEPLEIVSVNWNDTLLLELKNQWDIDLDLNVAVYSEKTPSLCEVDGEKAEVTSLSQKIMFPIKIESGRTVEIRCSHGK